MSDTCYRGQTLVLEFPPVLDPDRQPIDLTGATVVCKAQQTSGPGAATAPEIPASVASVVLGDPNVCAKAQFAPAVTAGFVDKAGYKYDAVATLPDGSVVPVGKGRFSVATLVSID